MSPEELVSTLFAALENDGKLYAYALDADASFHRVAIVDTGMNALIRPTLYGAHHEVYPLAISRRIREADQVIKRKVTRIVMFVIQP